MTCVKSIGLENAIWKSFFIEGLVNKARVIGIVPYIVTHNKISKLI